MILPSHTRWTLAELAAALGEPSGAHGDSVIDGVADLGAAGPTDLAALYDKRYAAAALASRAGVLIVPHELAGDFAGRPILASSAPRALFARAAALVRPQPRPAAGIDPSAHVAVSARLAAGVHVGPHVTIGAGTIIGERAVIGAGAVLLDEVEIGPDVWIHPRAVLYPRTVVGARSVIFAGAVIGAPGFGQARDAAGHTVRVPHLGRVVIEDDVEIGANSTVDRASFGETRIGARARLDNLVQIGHNVTVGPDALIAAQSGISGSSRFGAGAMMGGQSGLADHITVGDGAIVAAKTAVFGDVAAGEVVAGVPAQPIAQWRRLVTVQARLPKLWKTLKRLEAGSSD